MPASQFRMPDLLSLCPRRKGNTSSRHLDSVESAFSRWIDDCSLFSKGQKKSMKDAQIPLFIAQTLPYSSESQLRASVDSLCATIIFDDLTANTSVDDAQRLADMYENIFQSHGSASVGEDNKFGKILSELAKNIFTVLDPAYHKAFVDGNIVFSQATIQEAKDRENPQDAIGLKPYIETRRASIGVDIFFVLTQWTRGITLPAEVEDNLSLREIKRATIDLIFLANDMYSYKKEYFEDGAQHNIITVAIQDPSTKVSGLQESFDYAEELFKLALNRFEKSSSRLPSLGGDVGLQLGRYIEGAMDWVTGNILWSSVNRRYAVFDSQKSTESRVVTLKPPPKTISPPGTPTKTS